MLMSAARRNWDWRLPIPTDSAHRDLDDEARRLITRVAGLIDGAAQYLGRMQVRCTTVFAVQRAFREPARCLRPGAGPGEKYTGSVR